MPTLALLSPPTDPTQLLSDLKGLGTQLGKIKLPSGKLIGLSALAATLPEIFKQRLKNILKKTTKEKDDNRYVIKVADAVDCVNETLADPKTVLKMVEELLTSVSPQGIELGKPICDCIRENRLRQDTPRVITSKRYYHRPSKGHGKGRKSF